jgi:hypothetical protein
VVAHEMCGMARKTLGGTSGHVRPSLWLIFVVFCRSTNNLLSNVFKSFIGCSEEDGDAKIRGC